MQHRPCLGIVVPAHNEEGNLEPLYQALVAVWDTLPEYDFKLCLVDDGSKDQTIRKAREIIAQDSRVVLSELSRNFGKEAAVSAGLEVCCYHLKCNAVVIMDADLQHPPEVIPEFIAHWDNGYEVVATKRKTIENRPALKKAGSWLFYKILNAISETPMVSQTTDFRLIDRKVLELMCAFSERNRMVRGLIDWLGFRTIFVEFEAPERFSGEEGYTYRKLTELAINSITSYSLFPLRVAGYLGVFLTFCAGVLLAIMITDQMTYNMWSFTPLAVAVIINLFMAGVILSGMGLLALYIGKIYSEVQNRPLFVIRRGYGEGVSHQTVASGGKEYSENRDMEHFVNSTNYRHIDHSAISRT
ncbi:MAG: glycosyltransferase family 2 protein [Oligoflexales bacterium]